MTVFCSCIGNCIPPDKSILDNDIDIFIDFGDFYEYRSDSEDFLLLSFLNDFRNIKDFVSFGFGIHDRLWRVIDNWNSSRTCLWGSLPSFRSCRLFLGFWTSFTDMDWGIDPIDVGLVVVAVVLPTLREMKQVIDSMFHDSSLISLTSQSRNQLSHHRTALLHPWSSISFLDVVWFSRGRAWIVSRDFLDAPLVYLALSVVVLSVTDEGFENKTTCFRNNSRPGLLMEVV